MDVVRDPSQGNLTDPVDKPPQPMRPAANGLAQDSPLALPGLEGLGMQAAKEAREEKAALAGPVSQLQSPQARRPGLPTLQMNREPPPDFRDYHRNAMQFASAMAVLGAISGRFTRASGGAALGAFAGAMEGWQSGNLQAYEAASKRWDQLTRQTIENNYTVLGKYKLALENSQYNIDQMMAAIKVTAVQFHDTQMYNAADAGSVTLVGKLYDKGVTFTERLQGAHGMLNARRLEDEGKQALMGEMVASGQLDPNGIDPRTGQPYSMQDQQQMNYAKQQYLAGRYDEGRKARGGGVSGIRMSARNEIIQNYMDTHGGERPSEEEINAAEAKRAGEISAARVTASAEPRANANALTRLTQQQTAIQAWEKTAVANGEKLKQLAQKIDRTGYPAIEKWIRAGRQASGDPDVAAFNAQMDVYRAEVAKIISNPNLTGQLTDRARAEVENFMGGGASASQIIAVVDLLRQDFGRREKAIEDERQALLTRIKGGGEASTPSGATATSGGADPMGFR